MGVRKARPYAGPQRAPQAKSPAVACDGPLTSREVRMLHAMLAQLPQADRPLHLTDEQLRAAFDRHRRLRMPPWADGAAIRAIYAEARRLTAATGVPHEVDHVIPLLGARVSGLHVETNLQILTRDANKRKLNRHEGA